MKCRIFELSYVGNMSIGEIDLWGKKKIYIQEKEKNIKCVLKN